jgi:preprotein translocase subunit SecD
MKLRALAAVLGLLVACSTEVEVDETPRVEQVQPATFNAPHGLQFKVVDDGASVMKQLTEYVAIDRERGVKAEVDRWTAESGNALTDFYLTANAPGTIQKFVLDAGAKDPDLLIPPDRELVYQQIDSGRWRTYLVFPTAELDSTSIARSEVSYDPALAQPSVTVDFTPTAARHFSDLTARIAGHKLAVLVDGTVVSAPVINDRIAGGRAQITFGPSPHVAADAAALAAQLAAK